MAFIYGAIKGVMVGVVTLAVVASHGLTSFEKSLILAGFAGAIGTFGILGSAFINARANAQMVMLTEQNRVLAEENHRLLSDLARQQGITKRPGDPSRHA